MAALPHATTTTTATAAAHLLQHLRLLLLVQVAQQRHAGAGRALGLGATVVHAGHVHEEVGGVVPRGAREAGGGEVVGGGGGAAKVHHAPLAQEQQLIKHAVDGGARLQQQVITGLCLRVIASATYSVRNAQAAHQTPTSHCPPTWWMVETTVRPLPLSVHSASITFSAWNASRPAGSRKRNPGA